MKAINKAGLQTLTTAELFAARAFLEMKASDIEVALSNLLAPADMEDHMYERLDTLNENIATIASILETR
jgi:hypothetical protein